MPGYLNEMSKGPSGRGLVCFIAKSGISEEEVRHPPDAAECEFRGRDLDLQGCGLPHATPPRSSRYYGTGLSEA